MMAASSDEIMKFLPRTLVSRCLFLFCVSVGPSPRRCSPSSTFPRTIAVEHEKKKRSIRNKTYTSQLAQLQIISTDFSSDGKMSYWNKDRLVCIDYLGTVRYSHDDDYFPSLVACLSICISGQRGAHDDDDIKLAYLVSASKTITSDDIVID